MLISSVVIGNNFTALATDYVLTPLITIQDLRINNYGTHVY